MAFAAAVPLIAAGIGAASRAAAASADKPAGVLQLQPNKWANSWQDLGFGNTAAMMTALGNPMFANYLNRTSVGKDFKGMFGNDLSGLGFTPRTGGANSMGYLDGSQMQIPQYNPMVMPLASEENAYQVGNTLQGDVGAGSPKQRLMDTSGGRSTTPKGIRY